MNLIEKAKQVLSDKELELFMIMNGRNGTLFIQGHPGAAKSAILKAIAKKMGFVFVPKWAPAMDELDVGLYPSTDTVRVGKTDVKCVDYVPPKWAIEACNREQPTLVVIEEFNRNEKLMNASLSITNERVIAEKIHFPDHVFFAVTGNLGEEDGTSVDVLDSAQAGRMIVVRHTMEGFPGLEYWKTNFALEKSESYPLGRIHPDIIAYLDHKPSQFRPTAGSGNDGKFQVDARRWTQLSDFIYNNFGVKATTADYMDSVNRMGKSFIGPVLVDFVKYLTENARPTLDDVLAGKVKRAIAREVAAELINEAVKMEESDDKKGWLKELKAKEMSNLIDFVRTLDDDTRFSFLNDMWYHTQRKHEKRTDNSKKLEDAFPDAVEFLKKSLAEEEKTETK
jgi:hypothetical protein